MTTVYLDIYPIFTKEAFHEAVRNVLDLPAYYGRNLDALYDCLGDICTDTQLVVQNADILEKNLGPYGAVIRQVLQAAALDNPHFTVLWEEA